MLIDADPYPWPYDGRLHTERLAVVVVGAQEWFAARTAHPHDALDRVARLVSLLRPHGAAVIATRHGAERRRDDRRVLPVIGSIDHELVIDASAVDTVIDAAGMDAFY